jgi:hypothetical protein
MRQQLQRLDEQANRSGDFQDTNQVHHELWKTEFFKLVSQWFRPASFATPARRNATAIMTCKMNMRCLLWCPPKYFVQSALFRDGY